MVQMLGVFCEDIREEKSGQATLIGILPDNVNVPPPPPAEGKLVTAHIPKIGFYFRMNFTVEEDIGESFSLKFIFKDGKEQHIGEITPQLISAARREARQKGLPMCGIIMTIMVVPFATPVPTLVTAVVDGKSGRHPVAILNLVTQANPSQQQSFQPQSASP